jgi:hypothetical protein
MPRSAVVSVGISWGRPGTRTCGISVGLARLAVVPKDLTGTRQ